MGPKVPTWPRMGIEGWKLPNTHPSSRLQERLSLGALVVWSHLYVSSSQKSIFERKTAQGCWTQHLQKPFPRLDIITHQLAEDKSMILDVITQGFPNQRSHLPGFHVSAQRCPWSVSATGISQSRGRNRQRRLKNWHYFSSKADRLVFRFAAKSTQGKEKVDKWWTGYPQNVNHQEIFSVHAWHILITPHSSSALDSSVRLFYWTHYNKV